MKMKQTFQAKKVFAKSEKILNNAGGEYVSLLSTKTSSPEGFETIVISRRKERRGDYPGSRIIIKNGDEVVFAAEKIISFEPIVYRPGNWQTILDDELKKA